MRAAVTDQTGEIRGVRVRWVNVMVAGHTVEQLLSFDVAEAEAVHGRPFDDEMDNAYPNGHVCRGSNIRRRDYAQGRIRHELCARRHVHSDREDRALQGNRAHERRLGQRASGRHEGRPRTLELRPRNAAEVAWKPAAV